MDLHKIPRGIRMREKRFKQCVMRRAGREVCHGDPSPVDKMARL
ncbi:hypothetical protein CSC06_1451 [Escherichia coli]|nr:hypothetical protein CSC06_1451 [Escherichia coli]